MAATWPFVLHPSLESYVFQCHYYLVVNLFVLQHRLIWFYPRRVLPQYNVEALIWSALILDTLPCDQLYELLNSALDTSHFGKR